MFLHVFDGHAMPTPWTERLLPAHADDLAHAPLRCGRPIILQGGEFVPCGTCELCRDVKRRVLSHRIDLEARCHSRSAFVGLTYSPEFVPAGGHVSLPDMTLFLKRLRKRLAQRKLPGFRYYYVAEYAPKTLRPHYHAVLFGYPPCTRGRFGTGHARDGKTTVCCEPCELLSAAWSFGRVDSKPFAAGASDYVSGYVVKRSAAVIWGALLPEFARWSSRPGLATGVLAEIAQASREASVSDAPVALKYGDVFRPLGPYLQAQLRLLLGITAEQVYDARYRRRSHQQAADAAARSHGTSTPEMGARLAERVAARRARRVRKAA